MRRGRTVPDSRGVEKGGGADAAANKGRRAGCQPSAPRHACESAAAAAAPAA